MPCKLCETKSVYKTLTNINLCKNCFIKYFEKKVFKTISKYKLVQENDVIVVAVSGGKDSLTVLYLLKEYAKKFRNVVVKGLGVNEGVGIYRDGNFEKLIKFCDNLDVELKLVSFKEEFGKTLDESVKKFKKKKINTSPCNICGTFRRYLLNKYSREMKATRLATGHNLDDEAQNVLLNVFKNNPEILKRMGPKTEDLGEIFVQKIKPLYLVTEDEVRLYTELRKFDVLYASCPNSGDSFRSNISKALNKLENNHSGIKTSTINFALNFGKEIGDKGLETRDGRNGKEGVGKEIVKKKVEVKNKTKTNIKNNDRELFKKNKVIINKCEVCGEATQKDICNTCMYLKILKE